MWENKNVINTTRATRLGATHRAIPVLKPVGARRPGRTSQGMEGHTQSAGTMHIEGMDEADQYKRRNKYEYSVQLHNVPHTWAKRDRTVQAHLLAMLQSHTTVALQAVHTSENCHNKPKPGENMYCYAFVEVLNEDAGNKFTEVINKVAIDDDYVLARWSSKAKPRTPTTAHKVKQMRTVSSTSYNTRVPNLARNRRTGLGLAFVFPARRRLQRAESLANMQVR